MFKKFYVAEIIQDGVILGSANAQIWFWQRNLLAYRAISRWIDEHTENGAVINFRRVK